MSYWPWWLGGIALATVAVGFWLALGRLLGISGSFARALDGPEEAPALEDAAALEALLALTREEFGDAALADLAPAAAAPTTKPPLRWAAHMALLAALIAGGALGALSRGAWHVRPAFDGLGTDFTRLVGSGWHGLFALLGGGLLVGFGTSMAGGCTSGHGLCGAARLQRGSLLATATFFGVGAAVALLLERLR
jgi:uncharacterized protein